MDRKARACHITRHYLLMGRQLLRATDLIRFPLGVISRYLSILMLLHLFRQECLQLGFFVYLEL